MTQNLPFRAEIVGSFLRPGPIKEAREQIKEKKITSEQLTAIEDTEIVKLVNKLSDLGLKVVTDGEYRRSWWHWDFQTGFGGVIWRKWDKPHIFFSHTPIRPDCYEVVGQITYNPDHPFYASYKHLKTVAKPGQTIKVTIPSPGMFFEFHGNNLSEISENKAYENDVCPKFYKGREADFFNDISIAYNKTIKGLYDLGLRYLQIDDCFWNSILHQVKTAKTDADRANAVKVADKDVQIINLAIKDLPADLFIATHMCRGNYKSDWMGEGSYNGVLIESLSKLNLHAFFLEYEDPARDGGFDALATLSKNGKNQHVVLGVISSKFPELEKEEEIIGKIDEAAKYYPKNLLHLSTQCGFASTEEGNILTEEEQWAKVALVVRIAKKVWSDA